jgi:hypothetical protein
VSVTRPEANGQVERANRLILTGLKPRLYEELEYYGSKWIEELPKVVWGLRTQVNRATGYSPFFPSIWIRSRATNRQKINERHKLLSPLLSQKSPDETHTS